MLERVMTEIEKESDTMLGVVNKCKLIVDLGVIITIPVFLSTLDNFYKLVSLLFMVVIVKIYFDVSNSVKKAIHELAYRKCSCLNPDETFKVVTYIVKKYKIVV